MVVSPGHTGGTPRAHTAAPQCYRCSPNTPPCLVILLYISTLRRFAYEGSSFQTYSQEHFFFVVHVYKFSTKLHVLVTITGVEKADLICVVPKGSKNIWVFEEAADKNNIGEKIDISCGPENYSALPHNMCMFRIC